MARVKTYLIVWINSEGTRPKKVAERLASIGFKPMHGTHDFVFKWKQKPSVGELLSFADKIHETLRGLKVFYKMESL